MNFKQLIISFLLTIFIHNAFAQDDVEMLIGQLTEIAQTQLNEGNNKRAAYTLNKLGLLYWQEGMIPQAVNSLRQSAELFEHSKMNAEARNIYTNMGTAYSDINDINMAIWSYEQSLRLRRAIGDKNGIASGLIDLAHAQMANGYFQDATDNLEEALKLTTDTKHIALSIESCKRLVKTYSEMGNNKKSAEYAAKTESFKAYANEQSVRETLEQQELESKIQLAKSDEELREERLRSELDRLRAENERNALDNAIRRKQDSLFLAEQLAQSRQNQIDILNKENEQKQRELALKAETEKMMKWLLIAGVCIIILTLIFLTTVAISSRKRKRMNQKLNESNKNIKRINAEVVEKNKEIQQQKADIEASISAALSIQSAMLGEASQITSHIESSFIFFRPRDVVSGDFYWMREGKDLKFNKVNNTSPELNNKFFVSAIDCTGHGVPGAFMTMMGFNALNNITDDGIVEPNEILSELHRNIYHNMKQESSDSHEGMDMTICVIDRATKTMDFVGANNPLLYIQNGELLQIKGDRYGIGGGHNENLVFTKHTIDVSQPTWCYIFSDGYTDQFNSDGTRKFMIGPFKKLLLEIYDKSPEEQMQILEQRHLEFRGSHRQLDDMLIIGFKIDLK